MIAHGTAQDKAQLIVAAVEQVHGEAKVTNRRKLGKLEVRATLPDGANLHIEWDANGRFLYGDGSTLNGRKVRNVADAVRQIQTHARISKRNAGR